MLGALDIQRVPIKQRIILAVFLLLGVFMLGSGRAHAATLTVGPDCSIDGAITSINNGADHDSCTSTGTYGTNDIVDIPAGTHTLTGDLTTLTVPATIQGAGMGQTIVDGDSGQYRAFTADSTTVTFKDMKITAYENAAISTTLSDVSLENIDVDGTGSLAASQNLFGIFIGNNSADTKTVTATNVYLHDITSSITTIHVFVVNQSNTGTTNANLQNITLSNITNTVGSVNGFMMTIGTFSCSTCRGTVNADISNVTVDNINAALLAAPFSSVAFTSGGNSTITTSVKSATVTGTRGITAPSGPIAGIPSAAFYAAGVGVGSGDLATVNISVENSLFADNLTDTTPSNCAASDLSSNFSGSGSADTSITSLGHNISDDASCTSFTEEGDQQNIGNIISTLGSLQDNGGAVPTRALLTGSPAINTGVAVLGVSTDARGIARPSDCPSVGAFQYEGAVCAASTTTGSSGGAGNLADTGQNAKTSILVGTLLVSAAVATTLTRRKFVYKRR